jgi:hypothetical protein
MYQLVIDGGTVASPAKYTQPVSVPTPVPIQPLALGDPRNNSTFLADNAYAFMLGSNEPSITAGIPGYNPDMAAAMASMRQATYGLYTTTPPSTEAPPPVIVTLDPPPANVDPTVTPPDTFGGPGVPFVNAGFIPSYTPTTTTSDVTSIPQPQPAIAPIAYPFDTPTNLYIDINSFTKNSDGTYTANLTFDPIYGANKYNYRISATS